MDGINLLTLIQGTTWFQFFASLWIVISPFSTLLLHGYIYMDFRVQEVDFKLVWYAVWFWLEDGGAIRHKADTLFCAPQVWQYLIKWPNQIFCWKLKYWINLAWLSSEPSPHFLTCSQPTKMIKPVVYRNVLLSDLQNSMHFALTPASEDLRAP